MFKEENAVLVPQSNDADRKSESCEPPYWGKQTMADLPVTVPLWRRCSFRGRWLITCGHDTVCQVTHGVSPSVWGPGCMVANPRVDSDCPRTDSSLSSLPRPGSSVEIVSLPCVCVAATHRETGTGGGRRLQAMVVSTSLVTELCGSLLD